MKAVIFDLDGTLLYTLKDIADSVNYALGVYGYPVHDLEAHKYFVGAGAWEMIRRAMPKDATNEQTDIVLDEYTKRYSEHQNDSTKPYDGIIDALKKLNESNIPVCVLSNKPHVASLSVIAQHFDNIRFHAVLGQREGIPTKPDPAAALELAELLGICPCDIAFVGDSDVDIQTGRNAGMIPVGVTWGYRTEQELRDNGATHIINNASELLELFDVKLVDSTGAVC